MVDLSHMDKNYTLIKIFRNNIFPEQPGFFIRVSLVLIQIFSSISSQSLPPSIHLSLLQGFAYFGKLFFSTTSLLDMLTPPCTSSEIFGKVCLGSKKNSLKSTFFIEFFLFLQIWVHICFSQMQFCLKNASFFSKRTCLKEASHSRFLSTKGVD